MRCAAGYTGPAACNERAISGHRSGIPAVKELKSNTLKNTVAEAGRRTSSGRQGEKERTKNPGIY
jgi:hypothetical protein